MMMNTAQVMNTKLMSAELRSAKATDAQHVGKTTAGNGAKNSS